MLVKEVDKIDELEPSVKEELVALEKRWKKLLRWSEERGLRLSKIVSLWSKYRQEEIAILNWIDEKGEQLKVADEVNLADEEAVKEQLEIFKVKMKLLRTANSLFFIFAIFIFILPYSSRNLLPYVSPTDLNYWIKHPFEFSDPILKPEYL